MKDRAPTRLDRARLAAHADGALAPAEAAALERALAASPELRRRVESLRRVRDALAAPARELERVDLVARVRWVTAGAWQPPSTQRRPRAWRRLLWALAAATATCAALVGAVATRPRSSDGPGAAFTVKAAAAGAAGEGARWAGIRVYREAGEGGPRPLTSSLSVTDGLLFSYSNLGPRPFNYLMIFGRDAGGEVHWFFPAYERAGMDPSSIPIDAGRANVGLPELLRSSFHAGGLAIFGLFTREPRRVLEVERWLATWSPGQAPPWPDADLQIIAVSVER